MKLSVCILNDQGLHNTESSPEEPVMQTSAIKDSQPATLEDDDT
jgi:hypothetical protein